MSFVQALLGQLWCAVVTDLYATIVHSLAHRFAEATDVAVKMGAALRVGDMHATVSDALAFASPQPHKHA